MNKFVRVLRFIVIGLVIATVLSFIVMQLWNHLLPEVVGARTITFWQALGLLALCRILFGGFGWHRPRHYSCRNRMGDHFGRMSPEERDRFRQSVRDYCRQAVREHLGATPSDPKPEQP